VYVPAFIIFELVKVCPVASVSVNIKVPGTDEVVPEMNDASVVPYTILLMEDNVIDVAFFCTCSEVDETTVAV
jgi:hypothetical protein